MNDRRFLILVALAGVLVASLAALVPEGNRSRGHRLPPRRGISGGWSRLWGGAGGGDAEGWGWSQSRPRRLQHKKGWRGPRRVILFPGDLRAIRKYVGWREHRDSRFPGFTGLRHPELGSWRAGPGRNERHQSFDAFRRTWQPRPPHKRVLILRRVALPTSQTNARKELRDLETVMAEFLSLYYGRKTRWQDPLTGWLQARKRRSLEGSWSQLFTRAVGQGLSKRIPWDARLVLGVTHHDLYPHASWNFVFGEVFPAMRVGVMSIARLGKTFPPVEKPNKTKKDDSHKDAPHKDTSHQDAPHKDRQRAETREGKKKRLLRTLKILAHEVGHILGLPHCVAYSCLMNGSNNLQETDRAPIHLCPVCLAKMSWSLGLDPQKRYRRLSEFFKKQGLPKQAQWYDEQARKVTGTQPRTHPRTPPHTLPDTLPDTPPDTQPRPPPKPPEKRTDG